MKYGHIHIFQFYKILSPMGCFGPIFILFSHTFYTLNELNFYLCHLTALFVCPRGFMLSLRFHISSSDKNCSNSPKKKMISSCLMMWYCSFLKRLKLSCNKSEHKLSIIWTHATNIIISLIKGWSRWQILRFFFWLFIA